MDSRLLRSHMAREGKTGVDMAAELGMCYTTWISKSSGRKSFTVDEAVKLKGILSLTNDQACDIFFTTKGDF